MSTDRTTNATGPSHDEGLAAYGPGNVSPFRGVLPQLVAPDRYVACDLDLTTDTEGRQAWLNLFHRTIPDMAEHAVEEVADAGGDAVDARKRADQVVAEFCAEVDFWRADPGREGRLDILEVCYRREQIWRRHGFPDPYRLAKQKANDDAEKLLPEWITQLDFMKPADRDLALIRGVFAGNIFDLGAPETAAMFRDGKVHFHDTVAQLKPRPWRVDDADAWLERMSGPAHRCALLFVDNAGPDVTLGMLPLARHLLQRGSRVIMAANSFPSLNDVTVTELHRLIDEVAAFDPVVSRARAGGRLMLVGSGNGAPLIDLTRLSPELVDLAASERVDLVHLHGMGRAYESNWSARFNVECLKTLMVKDEHVAGELGGEMFDLVMRYEKPG